MMQPTQINIIEILFAGEVNIVPGKKVVIEPSGRRGILDLREIIAFRELLGALALKEIKVRYKQTLLGAAWVIGRPLVSMLIYTLLFGVLAKIPSEGAPYPVFVLSGLLPWTFFASTAAASAVSLVGSANLITKIYFPRIIVPVASMGVRLVDFAISFAVLLVLKPVFGVGWSVRLLAAPALLAVVALAAIGVGMLVSALTVAYRDSSTVLDYLLQIWMFATPIIYPVGFVPKEWQWILFLNPLTGVTEGFRAACLGKPFDLPPLAAAVGLSALLFLAGVAYFARVEHRFADII